MHTWHALGNSHCIRISRQVKVAAKLLLVFESVVIKKLFGIVFSSSEEISCYYLTQVTASIFSATFSSTLIFQPVFACVKCELFRQRSKSEPQNINSK